MNIFSSNINNISTAQPNNQTNNSNFSQSTNNLAANTFPQPQPQQQYDNMMNSKYMQSQIFNPILEDLNEEANYNQSTINSKTVNPNQRMNINYISINNAYFNQSNNLNNSIPNTQRQTQNSKSINQKIN